MTRGGGGGETVRRKETEAGDGWVLRWGTTTTEPVKSGRSLAPRASKTAKRVKKPSGVILFCSPTGLQKNV